MSAERVLAALALAVCVVMLARLMLGASRRHRLDTALRRGWSSVRRLTLSLRLRREAAREADAAIKRARGGGEWDGNVYTPKEFRKPPRDKMH